MPSITVWIVDDLPQTRAWLRGAVTAAFDGPLILDAGSLAAARRLRQAHGWPDLALIDLHLPDGRGTELIAELHRTRPDVAILVPTIFDDDAHLYDAMRTGAGGHLLKDQPVETLATALRANAAGAPPPLSPSLARRLLRELEAIDAPPPDAVRRYLQQRARGLTAAEATERSGIDGAALHRALAPLRPN